VGFEVRGSGDIPLVLMDPQIQRDPGAALSKWRRRQLWALVFTVAALLGAILGGGNEVVVAVIVVRREAEPVRLRRPEP
jgi:hypothetical protein